MNIKTTGLCLSLLALSLAGCKSQSPTARLQALDVRLDNRTASTNGAGLADEQSPKSPGKLTSGADDANIARVSALLLESGNFLQKTDHAEISARFFDLYMNALDPLHLYFLQSDAKEFEPLRPKLDDMMLKTGDTGLANTVFNRFRQHLDEQVAYVNDLLKNEKFTFETSDIYQLDRKHAFRPKDLAEAKQLWRERLRYEYLQEKLNKEKPEEIVKILSRRYSRLARAIHEYDSDDVLQLYITSLAHAYDPHSDYLGKASMANFSIQMKLSLVGIGALLGSEDGYCKIDELTPGGPAIRSGKLKVGDKIIAVGQGDKPMVDVIDMKIDKIVEMIRGQKGTEVRLKIIPADAPDPSTRKIISLVRDEVKLEAQEAKAEIIERPTANGKTQRLGVIDLPSFYGDSDSSKGKSCTADVARLLTKLKAEKVDGVVLDLRRNGGGSLGECIRMTGLFIKKGPVVQVKDSDGTVQVDDDPDPSVLYDGPLVVLTSKLSASASEILTGALQDYGRALVVGDSSTFGKGTVQTILPLDSIFKRNNVATAGDPGALKLTIQKFYRASGKSTQLQGVVPDIILPALTSYTDIGEKNLDNPLPFDTVPSAKFERLNSVDPYLKDLKARSDARLATDKDFLYLRQEIDRFKTQVAQKSVSLNEKQRRQEKEEALARSKARKEELLHRPASKDKVYALTVTQAGLPGPPPLKSAVPSKTETKKPAADPDDPESVGTEDKVPAVDITMEETRRILSDLISLSTKTAQTTAKH